MLISRNMSTLCTSDCFIFNHLFFLPLTIADGVTEFSVTGRKSKTTKILAQAGAEMAVPALPSTPIITKAGFNFKPSTSNPDINPNSNPTPKSSPLAMETCFAAAVVSNSAKEDEMKSLEIIIKCKEAEAQLFQRRADDAKREVENYCQLVQSQSEKLEEVYGAALARLCVQVIIYLSPDILIIHSFWNP
jgi:Coiled-coil region of Oberon